VHSRTWLGGAVGLLSAGVAVGVGEFVAAFVRPAAAPVIAVGNRIIVLTPESVKRPTINSVGTADKTLLLGGIYLLLAVVGAAVGILAVRNLAAGLVGVAAIGAFATYCAATANGARAGDVIPSIMGTLLSAAALVGLVRLAADLLAEPAAVHTGRRPDRRTFLQAGAATAALAALSGVLGRAVQHSRYDVTAKRAKVSLPPAGGDSSVPAGAELAAGGRPWATPSQDFYRIDTALAVPQLDPDRWRLRIYGRVDSELELSYADVLARPMIERWITLCCVSNPVGGPLVGNALFRGVRLADLLREAGVQRGADQLLLHSSDGYTFGAPTDVVMDGRDALLAVGMNGAPLPVEHGFPARTVVPGLYGYVSACKWIVGIEATTYAARQAYWVGEGWSPEPPIQLQSRIDTPRPGGAVRVGRPVAIAGVAWDQHVGVSVVEVQVDDGPWERARLARVPSTDTWRQWVYSWTPRTAGRHRLRVRATDAAGNRQPAQVRDPFPSGATGWHTVIVHAVG
jgi:DMSO/TMAO reductase YedYZ molybdopterin-dependent catalytic subunit